MPGNDRDGPPSFRRVIAHDVLLSVGLGALMAIAAWPYEEALALGWSWHAQLIAFAAGLVPIFALAGLRDLGFGAEFAKRMEAFYETAQQDPAFQLENRNVNARQTVVGIVVFFAWLLLTAGPIIVGVIAAFAYVPWVSDRWPLIVSIAIVPLTISISLTLRVATYAAVRVEERFFAGRTR